LSGESSFQIPGSKLIGVQVMLLIKKAPHLAGLFAMMVVVRAIASLAR
jgi:hypothetical protein